MLNRQGAKQGFAWSGKGLPRFWRPQRGAFGQLNQKINEYLKGGNTLWNLMPG